jgi:hypothetical protein
MKIPPANAFKGLVLSKKEFFVFMSQKKRVLVFSQKTQFPYLVILSVVHVPIMTPPSSIKAFLETK